MSTNLNFGRDTQGMNSFAPDFSTDLYSVLIASGTSASLTVPSTHPKWFAVISSYNGEELLCAVNQTAAIPAGNTFAKSNSIINPATLIVNAGDVIHFYYVGLNYPTMDLGVSFYVLS